MAAFKGDGELSSRKNCFWKAFHHMESKGYVYMFKDAVDLDADIERNCFGEATVYIYGDAYPVAEWVDTDLVLDQ